jgi:hypothetical protein
MVKYIYIYFKKLCIRKIFDDRKYFFKKRSSGEYVKLELF